MLDWAAGGTSSSSVQKGRRAHLGPHLVVGKRHGHGGRRRWSVGKEEGEPADRWSRGRGWGSAVTGAGS